MHCFSCGTDHPEQVTICANAECAAPLGTLCADCGAANPPQAHFCGGCGQRIERQTDLKSPIALSPAVAGWEKSSRETPAERRQLTVLFCDLVGSTALSEQLDPEELLRIVRAYHDVCVDMVQRHDGHIAQFLGDGVLIYFGYPTAHEDDPKRAARTALAILADVKKLGQTLQREKGVELSVRMGIHTGLAVVGAVGGRSWREILAIGEPPNLAARVQALADPDTIVMTGTTHRLVAPYFTTRELGAHSLKGFKRAVQLYQLTGDTGVETRMQAIASLGITPLVGRDHQLGRLLNWWREIRSGKGQVVLVGGEPGIGKSRLLEGLKEVLREGTASEAYTLLECYCWDYEKYTAFAPIWHLLRRTLGLKRGDSAQQQLSRINSTALKDAVPLVAPLLSIPPEAGYTPLDVTPLHARRLTMEALTKWVLPTQESPPVLLIVEDLHWADPSTQDFLLQLLRQVREHRMLLLLTFRSEFSKQPKFHERWLPNEDVHELNLNRLTAEQVADLSNRLADNRSLPKEVLDEVVKRTDGIPLFVEEMIKMLLDSGLLTPSNGSYRLVGPLPPGVIPSTIQDLLTARLDRLGSAKKLAQIGATIGHDFRHDLLLAVAGINEFEAERNLARLIVADLITRDGLPPQATYSFKHALIQEAARDSLLETIQKEYHQKIAHVLLERFPEIADTQPELLAQHFTRAGFARHASNYWYKAGERARKRSANLEAVQHVKTGLEQVSLLPDEAGSIMLKLSLTLELGLSVSASFGYAAQEVEKAYQDAQNLCEALGNPAELYPVLRGLCTFYIVRDELKKAEHLAEECLRLGRETQRPDYLIEGHNALGYILTYFGNLKAGQEHLCESIHIYRLRQGQDFKYPTEQDPTVAALSLLAHARYLLGDIREALRCSQESIEVAEAFDRPFDLVYAHCFAAMLDNLRREPEAAATHAGITIEISKQHGIDTWLGAGVLNLAIAKGLLGNTSEAIPLLNETLSKWRAGGAELSRPYFLAGLAESNRKAGNTPQAMQAVQEALEHAERYGEHWYDAELYRMRGELLTLAGDRETEAEADLGRALETALMQGAKLLELRAATSLHGFCLQRSQPERSRAALEAAYEALVGNGLEIPELQRARAFLSQSDHAS